jgi:peptidoglycan/LPS O-acetylase OafA/YrhL
MKSPQIKPLTSLRGIAAWGIVFYHFYNYFPERLSGSFASIAISHMNIAVDLFFIMSGFVISLNYSELFANFSAKNFKEFAIARLSRVYPLHFFMLLLFCGYASSIYLLSKSPFSTEDYGANYLVLSFLMLQNWGFTDHLAWNVPSWSISTEFACYILFPFASIGLKRTVRTRTATLAAAAVVMAAIGFVFWRFSADSIGDQIPKLGLFRCIAEFAIGMLLQQLIFLFRVPTKPEQLIAISVAVIMITVGYLFHWKDYMFIPAAFTALIFALLCDGGFVTRALSHPWLVFLGDISYSTYLCHYLIKRIVVLMVRDPHHVGVSPLLVYVAAVLVSSILLYRCVERPSRTFIRAMAHRPKPWRLEKMEGV